MPAQNRIIVGNFYIDELKLVDVIARGNVSYFRDELGNEYPYGETKKSGRIRFVCQECRNEKKENKWYDWNKKICKSCKYKGNGNPFFGKHHSSETKDKLSKKNKQRFVENPALKEKMSEIAIETNKRWKARDPDGYRISKQKGGYATLNSEKRFKINRIETEVLKQLQLLGIDKHFKYSTILDFFQFDFGSKEYKILIEVQGDYWHSNPQKYDLNKINPTQTKVLQKDLKKEQFAKNNKFKLFKIWETDIRDKDFSVLKEIKGIIDEANKNSINNEISSSKHNSL